MYVKAFENVMTTAVVCTQWGDTGKGKLVDWLGSQWADIFVRGTGGANAGHTTIINDWKHIFHLVPSGIIHSNKLNIIGNGVAFDPGIMLNELDVLEVEGYSYDNLRIAYNAKLLMPWHKVVDRAKDVGSGRIGTTGRGIGPLYTSHVARFGLFVYHLLNKDLLIKDLRGSLQFSKQMLSGVDPQIIKQILSQKDLMSGAFYHSKNIFNEEHIIGYYLAYGERLKELIVDTDSLVREALGKQHILLEGAQGNLLSIDKGTYPFVTSSDASIDGLATGSGLSVSDVDLVLNLFKFYLTRVGEGPFPTEFGGIASAEYCADYNHTAETEREEYPDIEIDVNDEDQMRFGIEFRKRAGEYGATTGRPRRNGWLDLPLLRYSLQKQVTKGRKVYLVGSKMDILDKYPIIKICTGYRYNGPDFNMGETILRYGDILNIAIPYAEILEHCEPIYQELPGWMQNISHIKNYNDLPKEAKDYITFIEQAVGAKIIMVTNGPNREQVIFVRK